MELNSITVYFRKCMSFLNINFISHCQNLNLMLFL